MTAPTRRVAHGRSHRYFLDGFPVPGVTTVIGDGVPKPALIWWAGKVTADYAIDHWDELADVGVAERHNTLIKAQDSARTGLGERGTEIHSIVRRLGAGEQLEVPEELLGHVDAYLKFAQDWLVEDLLAEVTIGNRRRQYMGTLDLIGRLVDGDTWLLDFKTGSGIYAESALQVAAYRHAEFYLDEEGNELELPEVDRCGIVHLRADGYDLYEADASERTFTFFLHAQQVGIFAREAKERGTFIGEAKVPPRRLEAAS